jgi:hypothetical protein
MNAKNDKIDELRWVRIFTPIHIPKYLVEQVRDKDFSSEDFFKFQEMSCITNSKDGPKLNPLNHLYVLANNENMTKGFVWFVIDSLSKDICINTFSMDKEYWYDGKAVEKLSKFIKDIRKKANLNKIFWITNYPKHSLRHGFKRSRGVLMEYSEEDNGSDINGRNKPTGASGAIDSTTKTVSGGDIRRSEPGTASGECIQPVLAAH